MRKKTCQELAELGWQYGLWDAKAQQWDALSVDVYDAGMWSAQIEGNGQHKVYTLETGEEHQ